MAKIAGCSTNTLQAIELGNRNLSTLVAGRIAQSTGASKAWLLKGDPSQPPLNSKDKEYTADDFVFSYVQFAQFSHAKDPLIREALQLNNQYRALELEEILNRAIKSKKWPLLRILVTDFRDSLLKEIGEKEGKLHFDDEKAARTFFRRWKKHGKNLGTPREPIKKIRDEMVEMIKSKKVTFNKTVIGRVLARHRLDRSNIWYPLYEAFKLQQRRSK